MACSPGRGPPAVWDRRPAWARERPRRRTRNDHDRDVGRWAGRQVSEYVFVPAGAITLRGAIHRRGDAAIATEAATPRRAGAASWSSGTCRAGLEPGIGRDVTAAPDRRPQPCTHGAAEASGASAAAAGGRSAARWQPRGPARHAPREVRRSRVRSCRRRPAGEQKGQPRCRGSGGAEPERGARMVAPRARRRPGAGPATPSRRRARGEAPPPREAGYVQPRPARGHGGACITLARQLSPLSGARCRRAARQRARSAEEGEPARPGSGRGGGLGREWGACGPGSRTPDRRPPGGSALARPRGRVRVGGVLSRP